MIQDPEFFKEVVDALENCDIPYRVVGSLVSIYFGEVRSTNDVDITIIPTRFELEKFLTIVERKHVVSRDAARDAFRRHTLFNVVNMENGAKIDLIIIRESAFEKSTFERVRHEVLFGKEVSLITPEDCILSKLLWSRDTQSEMQMRDVVGVMMVQWESIEWDYLHTWGKTLGISEVLGKAVELAEMRLADAHTTRLLQQAKQKQTRSDNGGQ